MSERNPVSLMDSVNAMDLLDYSYYRLKLLGDSPKRLAEIKEQERRHRWALRNHIDGGFERDDSEEPEAKKELTQKSQKAKVPNRRSK